MSNNTEHFVLRTSQTSPFGRKVRMAIDVLGLTDRVTLVPADTLDENDTLRQQNPLGKIPCLLRADGSAVFDSGVIIEFLADVAGTDRLLPARGPERFKTLTLARLADGITEAAILIIYEGRFRDPAMHSERWLEHQRGKITRALAAFEKAPPDAKKTGLVAIGLACALGYLDWRKVIDWRSDHPRLVKWLVDFAKNEPSFERTRPPNP